MRAGKNPFSSLLEGPPERMVDWGAGFLLYLAVTKVLLRVEQHRPRRQGSRLRSAAVSRERTVAVNRARGPPGRK
jgi:hypothetical protein